MPGMPAGKGQGTRAVGQTVKADMRARHLVAAGILPRDHHRRLVGVGARLQEEALVEPLGHHPGEPFREADLLHVEIAAVGVDQRVAGLFDRGRDGRVVVAERGAHLPGIEVEPALAGDVLDLGALAGHKHRPGDFALVHAGAEAVAPGAGEQIGFAVLRHRNSPVRCSAPRLRAMSRNHTLNRAPGDRLQRRLAGGRIRCVVQC